MKELEEVFPLNQNDLKKVYINISRINICDEMLYKAMRSNLKDLFY